MNGIFIILVSGIAVWSAILVQPVNIIDPVNPGTAIYIYWKTAIDATIIYGINDFSQSKDGTTQGAHLTGLVPGARYQYKVVCGSDTSITGSFRTSPPSGTPFSYAVFGDVQLEGPGERVYFREIAQNFKPDLMLIEGDLIRCDDNSCGTLSDPYDTLFTLAPELFANTILVPERGNHDALPVYQSFFSMLPDSGLRYIFNYGSAAFVVVAYVDAYVFSNGGLDDTLAASHANFKIGMSHNPAYGPTAITPYNYLWGYFFEAAGGNLWYSGHEHGFWRTRWIKSPNHWDWHLSTGFPPDYVSNIEKEGLAVYCNGGGSWTPGVNTSWAPYIVKADLAHPSYSIVTVDSVRRGVLNQRTYLYGTGLAMLDSFSIDHAVMLPDPLDSLTIQSVTAVLSDSIVEQYAYSAVRAIARYSNGIIDTTVQGCTFASLDSFVASVTPHGTIEARNIGMARIRVEKRGLADTVSLRVIPSTVTLDSLRLSNRAVAPILVGDTFQLSLTAYFHSGTDMFAAFVDTFAAWSSDNPALVAVAQGFIRGIDTGSSVKIIGSWKNKADTCLVSCRYRSLARYCEVTASDSFVIPEIGSLNFALTDDFLDSDTGNYPFMSGCNSTVNATEWVEVDLEGDKEMNQIVLFPRSDIPGAGFPVDFTLTVRTEAGATTEVFRTANYPNPGTSPCIFNFAVTTGRYVRLTATKLAPPSDSEPTCSRLQLAELQVFDHPIIQNEKRDADVKKFFLSVSPNPFNPSTMVSYNIMEAGHMDISLFDCRGNLVRCVIDRQADAGAGRAIVDSRGLSSGVYIVRLKAPGKICQQTITLIK